MSCEAKQFGDRTVCRACNLEWDTNDPVPPPCGKKNWAKNWIEDCLFWRHKVLTGKLSHWCHEFDGLPVDETCAEITVCHCFDQIYLFSKWTCFFVTHFGKKITSTLDGAEVTAYLYRGKYYITEIKYSVDESIVEQL